MQHSPYVYVKRVKGKGRGVFAAQPIRKGQVFERIPVIFLPLAEIVGGTKNPFMRQYCFERSDLAYALALGYGSLYNHSYRPNARYDQGPGTTMYFTAVRRIAAEEEITVNYNGESADQTPMWFDVTE